MTGKVLYDYARLPDNTAYGALVEALRYPVTGGEAKTWTYNPPECICDYLADHHDPACFWSKADLEPPYTAEPA